MSASSKVRVYDWERPEKAWDAVNEAPPEDPPAEDDPNDMTAEQAGDMLVNFLLGLVYTNSVSARSMCVACYWASLAGAKGKVSKFAVKPNSQPGKFQRRIDEVTGVKLAKEQSRMYTVKVPGHSRSDMSRTAHDMVMKPPHEELSKEFDANPGAAEGSSADAWSESYFAHPVVRANPEKRIIPFALYLDGIGFTRTDGMIGIFVYSLYTLKRHLVAVLRKSHLCRCGCRGWCSLYPIFSVIRWSVAALASGMWPSAPHIGEWGPRDEHRREKSGQIFGFVGVLLQVKGDWSEFSHTLGLADWSSKLHPCLFCAATRADRFDAARFSRVDSRWRELDHRDFDEACARCERWVTITQEQHGRIKPLLQYNTGGAGRSLLQDIPELGLLRHDRLEPHSGLEDVAAFDKLSAFPARVLFWRRAEETRARHRNPLWEPALGVSVCDSLMIDTLHTLYLGPAQVWVVHALWRIILVDAFRIGATGDRLHNLSLLRIRDAMLAYYKRVKQERPDADVTQVQDLTMGMLGGKPGAVTSTMKAAETKGMVSFVVELLHQQRSQFKEPEVSHLIEAGQALMTYSTLLDESPRSVPAATVDTMIDCVTRHLALCKEAGIPLKPKHHQLLHMARRTMRHGNPKYYSTFGDEGMNRVLKKVGQAAHRSVWETRVFIHFSLIDESRRGKKRTSME